MTQKILVMQRQAPYGNSLAREGVDYIFTCAAYDQDLSVLFSGDGVFQLIENQQSDHIKLKTHLGALKLFELYDIEKIYAISEDLLERNIEQTMLGIEVSIITRAEAKALIKTQQHIIGF